MNDVTISIEGLSSELTTAYADWGLERAAGGLEPVRWTFGTEGQCFAVARSEERIVGISGNIKHRMKFAKESGLGYQAVDSFVSTEARGQGLFVRLARAFAEQADQTNADLVWGFPNDNAATAWFKHLSWTKHGQVPFLIKPLRASYFLRRLKLPGDFPISRGTDQNISPLSRIGEWGDALWSEFSRPIGCATIRDADFLNWRLFDAPHADAYRVVGDPTGHAIVASREMEKHGARIGYIMEAMGKGSLSEILNSELARMRDRQNEIALAWAFPWSPNYQTLRKAGFIPFSEKLRPIHIWFGGSPVNSKADVSNQLNKWYLSYLDSDTV